MLSSRNGLYVGARQVIEFASLLQPSSVFVSWPNVHIILAAHCPRRLFLSIVLAVLLVHSQSAPYELLALPIRRVTRLLARLVHRDRLGLILVLVLGHCLGLVLVLGSSDRNGVRGDSHSDGLFVHGHSRWVIDCLVLGLGDVLGDCSRVAFSGLGEGCRVIDGRRVVFGFSLVLGDGSRVAFGGFGNGRRVVYGGRVALFLFVYSGRVIDGSRVALFLLVYRSRVVDRSRVALLFFIIGDRLVFVLGLDLVYSRSRRVTLFLLVHRSRVILGLVFGRRVALLLFVHSGRGRVAFFLLVHGSRVVCRLILGRRVARFRFVRGGGMPGLLDLVKVETCWSNSTYDVQIIPCEM